MNLIFVSTPYTDESFSGIEDNIVRAEAVSIALIDKGWSVITPPKNTAHYERYEPLLKGKGYAFWLEFYIEILKRCDAIIMCKGWKDSTGCKGEYKYAFENGIPIYFEEDGIPFPPEDLAEPLTIKEAAEQTIELQNDMPDDLVDVELGDGLGNGSCPDCFWGQEEVEGCDTVRNSEACNLNRREPDANVSSDR